MMLDTICRSFLFNLDPSADNLWTLAYLLIFLRMLIALAIMGATGFTTDEFIEYKAKILNGKKMLYSDPH